VPEDVAKAINKKVDGLNNQGDIDATGKVRFNGSPLVWIVCLTGGEYIYSE